MHDVKTHQRLRVMQHLDLTAQPDTWQRLAPNPPPVFAIVDDFIGTGETMCGLWEKQPRAARPPAEPVSGKPGHRDRDRGIGRGGAEGREKSVSSSEAAFDSIIGMRFNER